MSEVIDLSERRQAEQVNEQPERTLTREDMTAAFLNHFRVCHEHDIDPIVVYQCMSSAIQMWVREQEHGLGDDAG